MNPVIDKFNLPNLLDQRAAQSVVGRESEVVSGEKLIYWVDQPRFRLKAIVRVCELPNARENRFGLEILEYLHKGQTDRSWRGDYITSVAANLYFPPQPVTDQDIEALSKYRTEQTDLRRQSFSVSQPGLKKRVA